MNSLVLPTSIVAVLDGLLATTDESAGMLYCNVATAGNAYRFLAQEFEPFADEDYEERSPVGVQVSAVAFNRVLNRARASGLALFQVHTHPMETVPCFSLRDDAGERDVIPTMFRRIPAVPHGALVIGKEAWTARMYRSPVERETTRILEVGRDLRRLDHLSDAYDERHDRTILAIGRAGQQALQETRVGIVGLGGTGSHVAQQLAYLGIRDIVLIDDDRVSTTNLNRLIGAADGDVGSLKVDLARRDYLRVVPDAKVDAVSASVVDEACARRLLGRDLLVCCTDSQGSRGVLNWISYQYFMPLIDMGVDIRATDDGVLVTGRVQLVGPALPCLHCCGVVDLEQFRVEMMTEEERGHDQYVNDTAVTQPAVVSINGVVASLGVTMFMAMTTGLPMRARMQTYFGAQGNVRASQASSVVGCPVCDIGVALGAGDTMIPVWRATMP